MRFITFVLIVIVLLMIFFIPIADAIIDRESHKIVSIIDNVDIDCASAHDAALIEATDAFGLDVAENILLSEHTKYERVNVVVRRTNIDQWKALFFFDSGYGYNAQESVIIDEFNVNGNNSIAISGILCDAYNDIFTAFKYRLEHEQK